MAAPLQQDIQKPFDPTGYPSISGSQLGQLVDGESPADDKGIVLVTVDTGITPTVPDATTTTKWQRYIWLRVSATLVSVYVWNPNGGTDATFLKWISINVAGIGVGSIINSMIADNTIESGKIVSLDYSKLTGVPTGLPPGGPAGGVLTGSYPDPSIGNLQITAAMVALATLTAAQIAPLSLTLALDAPVSGSAKDMSRVNVAATGMEAFTPPVLFTSGVVVPTANALKIPQVNAGGTDFQMVALTTIGARILQIVETRDKTADTTALTNALTTLPTTSTCKLPAGLTAAITPVSGSSTLLIEVVVNLCSTGSPGTGVVGLFQDAVANAIAASAVELENPVRPSQCVMRFSVASGSTAARTYKVGFSGDSGNTRYNSTDGTTTMFGGTLGIFSAIRVTEYI